MSNIKKNIHDMRRIAGNIGQRYEYTAANYNSLMTIEEKMINLQKYINDTRTKYYMAQNLLERSFEDLENLIMRTEDVSSVSSETKNILKVDLDMPSTLGKSQVTTNADNIRTGDISLSTDKNILKGIQEMSILLKDKSPEDNSPSKSSKKEKIQKESSFFQKKKQKTHL